MMSIFQKLISASAFAALLIGGNPSADAQDMPQVVVGASGDYYTSPMFGDLHWTVGEVAVSQFQNEIALSEGFHQMYHELIVDIYEAPSSEWLVRVFPNPTTEYVQADWASNGTVQAKLMTTAGKEVLLEQQMMKDQQIDLSGLPAGTYFLQLRNSNGQQGTFRILKVRK
ncbi:T9SS type A sorting domain-containing protein [Phaeodactylibacter luteus]|nr:T9SS type A sorting domain-containing protein [Phaeodactylibacter luteus]